MYTHEFILVLGHFELHNSCSCTLLLYTRERVCWCKCWVMFIRCYCYILDIHHQWLTIIITCHQYTLALIVKVDHSRDHINGKYSKLSRIDHLHGLWCILFQREMQQVAEKTIKFHKLLHSNQHNFSIRHL